MGMYDQVSFEDIENHFNLIDWGDLQVDNEIVEKIKQQNTFQTKCLDNCLSNYMIFFDGSLKSQHFEEYEHISDRDSPLKFRIQKKGEYWMNEDFDGVIKIYDTCSIKNDGLKFFVEFKLKFAEKKLQSIKCSDIHKI